MHRTNIAGCKSHLSIDEKLILSTPLKGFLYYLSFLIFFIACKKEPPPTPNQVDKYSITPGTVSIDVDAAQTKTLYLLKDKDTVPSGDIIWKSLNEEVVVFLDAGTLQAKWGGQTEVVAQSKDGRILARSVVTVIDNNVYKFRLQLKDKGTNENLSINNPLGFLSAKAIARRQKQNISITDEDLPISNSYLNEIAKLGGVVVAKSKWLKTISVQVDNSSLLQKIKALPFIADAKVVWRKNKNSYQKPNGQPWVFPGSNAASPPTITITDDVSIYGQAYANLKLNKGNVLHKMGYKGRNINIAVIDEGFKNIDKNPILNNLNILGAKSFVYELTNPYIIDNHGTSVLSIMGGAKPNEYVGSAPEASYWLLTTEDDAEEFPIEEDYYVNALEYADSAGVDIVNTSLGYTEYDLAGANNTFEILDGKTAFATRGVNKAFTKGILVVVAAGNDGGFVGSPADSPDAISIGMTYNTGTVVPNSSRGLTVDGRIKPDLIAFGYGSYFVIPSGTITTGIGTSYATPAITGLAACLWQAFPQLTNRQIADVLRSSADKYLSPALPYGYGLPDMEKAYNLALNIH